MTAGRLKAADGMVLRYAVCPGPRITRGTVCIFQGRGDFIERYFETIKDLQVRGYDVAILDWRGQGGSDRRLSDPYRIHVRSFREYDLDLAAFMTEVVLPDCRPPFVALGHSTGGLVLLRALKSRNWFERAILSAPLIDIAPVGLPRPLVRFAARAMTLAGLGRLYLPGRPRKPMRAEDFPGNWVTSDRMRYLRDCRALVEAPQLGIGGPTFGWLNAAMGAMAELARYSRRTTLCAPVLIVAAGDDRLASSEASRQFARRVPGVAAVTIAGARHEPLMERDELREQFWAAFDSFVGVDAAPAQPSVKRALA
ncbi:MAG: alpha/beta fold hydrolase [Hyphomicrobiales bacterium]